MAQMLLDHGALVNCTCNEGETPLHIAPALGKVEMVQLLLRRGANINMRANKGATAVTMALAEHHLAMVQLLLNKGARVSADELGVAARLSVPEGVLVVAALGPAADASVLSDACRSAAAASRMNNVAVLLKQLYSIDPAVMLLVVMGLSQFQEAHCTAACVNRWLAETKSVTEQQQRLDQQQRQVAAERLAAQQLLIAVVGMQWQVATERQALRQHPDGKASMPEAQGWGSWAREWQSHVMTTAAGLMLLVLLK
jgi:hypothetical protein